MKPSQKHVILFGATGLVGSKVLLQLQQDKKISRIDVLARTFFETKDSKTFLHQSDLESVQQITTCLAGIKPDMALCCLGTTMAKAKTREAFFRVDHDLILNAAQAAKVVGVRSMGVISSVGAKLDSPFYYPRVKAQTEQDLRKLNFERLVLLRPSVLVGNRHEHRPAEKCLVTLAPLLSPLFIGPLKRWRFVSAQTVAHSLTAQTAEQQTGTFIIENENIL